VNDIADAPRPDRSNWLQAPGNRWAFRHARELFWSEKVGTRLSVSVEVGDDEPFTPAINDYLHRSHTDALVVLHQGTFVHEWYAPGVRADDRHMVFSVTKSIVGLVATRLIVDGVFDENTRVSEIVPEATAGGYGTATVRQLLDMTAAVRFVEDYEGPDLLRYRQACGQVPSPDPEGIHSFVASLPQGGLHGRAFQYASPTTEMAAWICERATGRTLAQLIEDYVWRPMGAEAEADMLLDPLGSPRASGGFCSTARDMARIGALFIGTHADGVMSKVVADISQPGDPAAWNVGSLANFLPGASYRSFWYQPDGNSQTFLAAGIYGQRIFVDAPRQLVIAQQASLPNSYDHESWTQTLPLFERIARRTADVA
jgi:CubicO group peptidase (beta-lactamase class C family)